MIDYMLIMGARICAVEDLGSATLETASKIIRLSIYMATEKITTVTLCVVLFPGP